jgi:threonine dehydratase
LIAKSGASIQQIAHDRVYSGPDVSSVRVVCDVETHDQQHIHDLQESLKAHGIKLQSLAQEATT